MKKYIGDLITFLILTTSTFSVSSQPYTYIPSGEVMDQAYTSLAEGDTTKALNLLSSISEADTNYRTSLADRIYIYNQMDDFETALALTNEALEDPGDIEFRLILLKSVALKNLKRFEEAKSFINWGMERFPLQSDLYLNLASVYESENNIDAAVEQYKKAIFYNYFSTYAHGSLGYLYASNGEPTKAALCLTMAVLVENDGRLTSSYITFLEKVLKVENKIADQPHEFNDDVNFETIDLLLKNKIALSSKYKVKSVVEEYNLTKSLNLIFEKLPEEVNDEFWDRNYISFFKEAWKNKQLDGMIMYMLMGFADENEKVSTYVTKNEKTIQEFINYSSNMVQNIASRQGIEAPQLKKGTGLYFEDGTLSAVGEYQDKPMGNWTYYHPNGVASTFGSYNKDGQADGKWIWYNNEGDSLNLITFKKGKKEGLYKEFHPNGYISQTFKYENEKTEGEILDYYYNGALYSTSKVKADIKNGKQVFFHMIGTKATEVEWQDGVVNTKVKKYYPDESISEEIEYTNTQMNGNSTYYYQGTGQISAKGNYKDGLQDGEWIWYHPDGKLKQKGAFLKNSPIGHWEEYDINGVLQSAYDYDENTKKNGASKLYFEGKLVREEQYNKGDIKSYKCYDLDGNLLNEASANRKELEVEMFHPTGEISAEGKMVNGLKDGVWKFYAQNGALNTSEFYNEKGIHGVDTSFYDYGIVESLNYYEDGIANGPQILFYGTGDTLKTSYFDKGKLNGHVRNYRINGFLESESYYLDDEIQGPSTTYGWNGKPLWKYDYDNGFLIQFHEFDTNGIETYNVDLRLGEKQIKVNYPNGNTRHIASYLNGIGHGKYAWFYWDGSIETEGQIFNGERHGLWIWKNTDGALATKGSYNYGIRSGKWEYFDWFGRKDYEGSYNKNGNREGTWTYYHPNGEISLERNYKDGELFGPSTYFDPYGVIIYSIEYRNSMAIGYTYSGIDGNLKPLIPLENESGVIEAYFEDGTKAVDNIIYFGVRNGTYEKFDSKGKLMYKCSYVYGMEEGLSAGYYPNGNISEEIDYLHGTEHGTAKYYHDNGNLYLEANYKLGMKHGSFKYYNREGKNIKTVMYSSNIIVDEF